MKTKRIIVAVTGASGSIYARLLCEKLAESDQAGEIALITTRNGEAVMHLEDRTDWLTSPRFTRFANDDLFAAPASGSADYDAMVVIPCSMGMIGRLASGSSNDLVSRAADVMLKERKTLILVPREAPWHTIHLRNLTALSECGAVVCPAAPSFYSKPETVERLCNTLTERIVSLLGIDSPHFQWRGKP